MLMPEYFVDSWDKVYKSSNPSNIEENSITLSQSLNAVYSVLQFENNQAIKVVGCNICSKVFLEQCLEIHIAKDHPDNFSIPEVLPIIQNFNNKMDEPSTIPECLFETNEEPHYSAELPPINEPKNDENENMNILVNTTEPDPTKKNYILAIKQAYKSNLTDTIKDIEKSLQEEEELEALKEKYGPSSENSNFKKQFLQYFLECYRKAENFQIQHTKNIDFTSNLNFPSNLQVSNTIKNKSQMLEKLNSVVDYLPKKLDGTTEDLSDLGFFTEFKRKCPAENLPTIEGEKPENIANKEVFTTTNIEEISPREEYSSSPIYINSRKRQKMTRKYDTDTSKPIHEILSEASDSTKPKTKPNLTYNNNHNNNKRNNLKTGNRVNKPTKVPNLPKNQPSKRNSVNSKIREVFVHQPGLNSPQPANPDVFVSRGHSSNVPQVTSIPNIEISNTNLTDAEFMNFLNSEPNQNQPIHRSHSVLATNMNDHNSSTPLNLNISNYQIVNPIRNSQTPNSYTNSNLVAVYNPNASMNQPNNQLNLKNSQLNFPIQNPQTNSRKAGDINPFAIASSSQVQGQIVPPNPAFSYNQPTNQNPFQGQILSQPVQNNQNIIYNVNNLQGNQIVQQPSQNIHFVNNNSQNSYQIVQNPQPYTNQVQFYQIQAGQAIPPGAQVFNNSFQNVPIMNNSMVKTNQIRTNHIQHNSIQVNHISDNMSRVAIPNNNLNLGGSQILLNPNQATLQNSVHTARTPVLVQPNQVNIPIGHMPKNLQIMPNNVAQVPGGYVQIAPNRVPVQQGAQTVPAHYFTKNQFSNPAPNQFANGVYNIQTPTQILRSNAQQVQDQSGQTFIIYPVVNQRNSAKPSQPTNNQYMISHNNPNSQYMNPNGMVQINPNQPQFPTFKQNIQQINPNMQGMQTFQINPNYPNQPTMR